MAMVPRVRAWIAVLLLVLCACVYHGEGRGLKGALRRTTRMTALKSTSTQQRLATQTDPTQLASDEGYQVTQEIVNTTDGFGLNLMHITTKHAKPNGEVVYLQHGLFDSTDTWLLNGKAYSLPLLLSDQGYDVWLGNSRGNQYSTCTQYKWTWDEMAQYDLPALISAVLEETQQTSLTYIGHSQGSTILFAALSRHWVNANQIKLFIALGPPLYLAHQRSSLMKVMSDLHVDAALSLFTASFFTLTVDYVGELMNDNHCDYNSVVKYLFGPTTKLNDSNWHGHFPAPTSALNVKHWAQAARSGKFEEYVPHMLSTHHAYVLSNIPTTAKIAMFIGTQDYLATVTDARTIQTELDSRVVHFQEIDGFAHMDFTWSKQAVNDVYASVFEVMSQHAK